MNEKKLSAYFIHLLQHFKTTDSILKTDIVMFLRQAATLISAHIPLTQSFEILARSQQKEKLRTLISTIKYDILSGKNLFNCLERHAHYFDYFTCRLIQIGEQTGKLDIMLNVVANHHEKILRFKRDINKILFYPAIITAISLIVTGCMCFFVIPRFAELFKNTNVALPFITQCIFYFANKLHQYAWLFGILLLLIILLYQFKNKIIRQFSFKIILSLPFIKHYLEKINLSRFTHYLALSISTGIPLSNALALITNVFNTGPLPKIILQLRYKINTGLPLHQAMMTFKEFPALMIQMIKIGEESGSLENMLNRLTEFIEADTHQYLQKITLLLEPLIMVVLGVLIGGLIIGMYLPIFKLGNTI